MMNSNLFYELEFLGFDPLCIRETLRVCNDFDTALSMLNSNKVIKIESQLIIQGVPKRLAKKLALSFQSTEEAMRKYEEYLPVSQMIREKGLEMGFDTILVERAIDMLLPFDSAMHFIITEDPNNIPIDSLQSLPHRTISYQPVRPPMLNPYSMSQNQNTNRFMPNPNLPKLPSPNFIPKCTNQPNPPIENYPHHLPNPNPPFYNFEPSNPIPSLPKPPMPRSPPNISIPQIYPRNQHLNCDPSRQPMANYPQNYNFTDFRTESSMQNRLGPPMMNQVRDHYSSGPSSPVNQIYNSPNQVRNNYSSGPSSPVNQIYNSSDQVRNHYSSGPSSPVNQIYHSPNQGLGYLNRDSPPFRMQNPYENPPFPPVNYPSSVPNPLPPPPPFPPFYQPQPIPNTFPSIPNTLSSRNSNPNIYTPVITLGNQEIEDPYNHLDSVESIRISHKNQPIPQPNMPSSPKNQIPPNFSSNSNTFIPQPEIPLNPQPPIPNYHSNFSSYNNSINIPPISNLPSNHIQNPNYPQYEIYDSSVSIRLNNNNNQPTEINLQREHLGRNFEEAYENLTIHRTIRTLNQRGVDLPYPDLESNPQMSDFLRLDIMLNDLYERNFLLDLLRVLFQPQGLSEESIKKFPKEVYKKSLNLNSDTCVICYDDFEEGVEIYILTCHHPFHSECIAKWLQGSTKCPLCKHDLSENNGE
ncbi:hypothetical protein SteCoe_1618 [Stentor coeruleus]|uniref:RING-type domain-containing protein n=1 Tax=Stentor coeruleus TaxID=5963 RepID=A0A1R2D1D5_9CILI|nr:hypothetical protein SteCoe_1618 [Stentor coeruleus]